MSNKEEKQFQLNSKENCCIYLHKIITSSELCMDKFKVYNKEAKSVLEHYEGKKVLPYDKYSTMCDKTYNLISYLLNLLGDAQGSSISYFKYRKVIEKRIKNGNIDIPIYSIDDDVKELLQEFNKKRNWLNHVPESLLISEMKIVNSGDAIFPRDPIEIYHYKSVEYEYYKHLYLSNLTFCNEAKSIIQSVKKEYSLLMNKHIYYHRVYIDKPLGFSKAEAAKMSAKVQGLKEETY